MCGRSSLDKTEKELEERFNATFYSDELERYNPLPNINVCPSHIMPIISNLDKEHFSAMRWGLIPFWAKDIKIGYKMINARKETILEKASFKKPMQNRRCLVPATAFYEWKKLEKGKQVYRITTTDNDIFSMAGLWETWTSPEGKKIQSFTVITQNPNSVMKDIHDRMPAILTRDQENIWLSDDISPSELLEMIEPYPDENMKVEPINNDFYKQQLNLFS